MSNDANKKERPLQRIGEQRGYTPTTVENKPVARQEDKTTEEKGGAPVKG